MKNPLLYDTGSAMPEWRNPIGIQMGETLLKIAEAQRQERNIALHNSSLTPEPERNPSWAN